MREVIRSNDPVMLAWMMAVLTDAGIPAEIFDLHASSIEGSIGAIPRRLMVPEGAADAAAQALAAAGYPLTPGKAGQPPANDGPTDPAA